MERNATARKTHASTADLLTWTEVSLTDQPYAERQTQPSDGVKKVVFGGQLTDEEADSVLMRKPCSHPKLKEMTGSGIFSVDSEDGQFEAGSSFSTIKHRTNSQVYQQTLHAISQISFGADEDVTPKKPSSLAEVAKQRELSGTLQNRSETKLKQLSDLKCKELSGHDIFAPSEVSPRQLVAQNMEIKEKDGEITPRNWHIPEQLSKSASGQSNYLFGDETTIKTAKKIHNQKVAELTGNDIFKGDAPPSSAEKTLSTAKLKEMSGNDIFADGKAPSRDYFGGVRKPPGGESNIVLI